MNKTQKVEAVAALRKDFEESHAVYLSDYRSLKVNDLTELRKELRKNDSNFQVVKNRLALRAVDEGLAKELEPHFDNMTAVTFAKGDIAGSAKALTQFAKTNENLKIKAGILDGKVISMQEIKALSDLPSREQLLGQLAAVWNAVPTGFVRVLNAVPNGFVNVLDALKRQKEEKGE